MNPELTKTLIATIRSIRLPGRLPRSCGFVQFNDEDALEVELYDLEDMANSLLGKDVAVIYSVASSQWPILIADMKERQIVQPLPRRPC